MNQARCRRSLREFLVRLLDPEPILPPVDLRGCDRVLFGAGQDAADHRLVGRFVRKDFQKNDIGRGTVVEIMRERRVRNLLAV